MTDIKPDLTITDLPDPRPSDPIEALSWLGETEEEVVRSLRERGIKGQKGQPLDCPLAVYLHSWWPNAWVGHSLVGPDMGLPAWVETPPAPQSFRNNYDQGRYPDLIDNG